MCFLPFGSEGSENAEAHGERGSNPVWGPPHAATQIETHASRHIELNHAATSNEGTREDPEAVPFNPLASGAAFQVRA